MLLALVSNCFFFIHFIITYNFNDVFLGNKTIYLFLQFFTLRLKKFSRMAHFANCECHKKVCRNVKKSVYTTNFHMLRQFTSSDTEKYETKQLKMAVALMFNKLPTLSAKKRVSKNLRQKLLHPRESTEKRVLNFHMSRKHPLYLKMGTKTPKNALIEHHFLFRKKRHTHVSKK